MRHNSTSTRLLFNKRCLSQKVTIGKYLLLKRNLSTIASGKRNENANTRPSKVVIWSAAGATALLLSGTGLVLARNSSWVSKAVDNANKQLTDYGETITSNIKEYIPGAEPEKKPGFSISRIMPERMSLPWKGLSFLRSPFSVDEISSTISSWAWPASFTLIKAKTSALLLELGMGPGSLFSQVVNDPPDPRVHPECTWDAEVRFGDDLCLSERAFLRDRRRRMRRSFAQLLEVEESEIDERDVPIVALACSGGGYRAMINTAGSLIGAQESGLLDCVTYTAGISGSCWTLGALYSGVAGSTTPQAAADHLKSRITTSYLDLSTLDILITPPTNKYLLAGLLRKANSQSGAVSLTDLYGTLVSARLFVPDDINKVDPTQLSLFQFSKVLQDASMPLPIFTAISRELPTALEKPLAEVKGEKQVSVDSGRKEMLKQEEKAISDLAPWLWFEFTPFEVGCDELGAWIPSWALGRRFEYGKSTENIPEVSFSILSGIFASAFCASLQHYFVEVQPILRQLPTQLYEWLNDIVTGQDLDAIHPVIPNELPNFVKGLTGLLKENSPAEITERDHLGFMDAGAELNIPYYPLLRRDVDCIIALDASADYQDLWFTRAEEYAMKRGIRTWPKGARWPAALEAKPSGDSDGSINIEKVTVGEEADALKTETADESATRKLAEAQESEVTGQEQRVGTSEQHEMPTASAVAEEGPPGEGLAVKGTKRSKPISTCTIWIGSSASGADGGTPSETSLMDQLEEEDLLKRDGIAIVYNPLIPNESAVPGFDPMDVSTWSLSMEEEQTVKLLNVAEANFLDGRMKVVRLLRVIWQRKKAARLAREASMSPTQS